VSTTTARSRRIPLWLQGLAPLLVVVVLAIAFLAFNPIGSLRAVPPVEAVAFERTTFEPGLIRLQVRNDGPDSVTVSQVLVNGAYRDFTITSSTLGRLEDATVRVAYPWDEGLPVTIGLVTSTGLVIEHEVEVAALTPAPDAATLGIYALLGVYIGVIPVLIGLWWFPALRQASRRWLDFFLSLTLGLLVFLLVDTLSEGLELAGESPAALDGLGLFGFGAIVAVLGLGSLEVVLQRRRADGSTDMGRLDPLMLAYLVAAGIGLHNLGEGLAVGAALASGELAVGTSLVLGFALHNTTEGLAIVAPLGSADSRPSLWHFAGLGALAGAPTIAGAWAGGFAFTAAWAALAFGVAVGAIAQVVWQIGKQMDAGRRAVTGFGALGLGAGWLVMYVTGLLAA
jgi:zinc transporter, ZIP family